MTHFSRHVYDPEGVCQIMANLTQPCSNRKYISYVFWRLAFLHNSLVWC